MARLSEALLLFALVGSLVPLPHGYDEFSPEDDETVPTYEVVVPEGKKLKLTVSNYESRHMYIPRWYHNDQPVSKSRCRSNYGELECPAVSRHDAGRYEMWGINRRRVGRQQLMFSAYVRVTADKQEPRVSEPISHAVEYIERAPPAPLFRARDDCFCSGVTERCRMATDLYRVKLAYNLSDAVSLDLQQDKGEEAVVVQYLAATAGRDGNLVTSYGGKLRFSLTNDCYQDRGTPCVVLVDRRNVSVGYFLPPQHSQREVSVLMTEAHWRLLIPSPSELNSESREVELDKFTFLTVLSHFRTLYVRGRYRSRDDRLLTIEAAGAYDEGLGMVSTVEECQCHQGYVGLSCERCDKGYMRIYEAVNPGGVCVGFDDRWQFYKQKYQVD